MPQDRHGLALAVLSGHFGYIMFSPLTLAHEQRGGFGEGPLKMGVTDASTREAVAFTRRLLGALDQTGIGAKLLYRRKATDVLDFVKDHQRQYRADTGHGPQSEIGARIMALGMADDIGLQCLDLILHAVHEMDIRLYILTHAAVVKAFGQLVAIGAPFKLLVDAGEVVLEIGELDMCLQFGTPVDKVIASPQQVPGRTHLAGIDVGQGEGSTPDQLGDLLGIDLVVLGLSAMDRFHVERMAQYERDVLGLAEIGQPIPGEDALDTDYDIVPVGCNQLQEPVCLCRDVLMKADITFVIEYADIHHLGMQVDSTVILVRSVIESHVAFLLIVTVTLDFAPKFVIAGGRS